MPLTESTASLMQVTLNFIKMEAGVISQKLNGHKAKMQLKVHKAAHGLISILLEKLKISLDLGQTKLWKIKQTKPSIS